MDGAYDTTVERPTERPFARVDRATLRRFLELGTIVSADTGEAVVDPRRADDAICVLLNGRVASERDGRQLRELATGEFFGEAALFGPAPAPVTYRALGPARVLRIARDAAVDYLMLYPEFGAALCGRLVRDNLARLDELSEVYVANRRLTDQMETQNANLRHAILAVEQTARLVSQSPHPVLRIARSGLLLFANTPAEPILAQWRCAIGSTVPRRWSELVADALASGAPRTLEAAIGERIFSFVVTPLAERGYANVYAQDVSEARRKAALIEHMALHDDLTGLPNRAALHARIDARIAGATVGSPGALMLIDLDGLEPIRALFGHPVSDALLMEASRRLDAIVGATGLAATLGGHHFAVLLEPAGAPPDEASTAVHAEAIVASLTRPFEIDAHRLQVGVRLGITFVGIEPDDSSAAAMKRADLAKHQVGSAPAAAFCFYRADLEHAMREQHLLERELHRAIGTDQIEVVFQPKVRLSDGAIIGAEALTRWRHPTRGLVPPDRFIPIAEQTGAIRLLGEQVLRSACRAATRWPDDLHVAVNLSALQLRQADIADDIAAILDDTGLAPHRLDLEITESLLVEDIERAAETLERLRAQGVRLSLDDFGTGYSCLSYLARLKFDKLKIDRSFVIGMHRSREMRRIVQTIARLGANLELTVVAEGIELPEQWQQLRELGCAEGQGYLFSAPLTRTDLEALLAAGAVLPAAAHSRYHDTKPVPLARRAG